MYGPRMASITFIPANTAMIIAVRKERSVRSLPLYARKIRTAIPITIPMILIMAGLIIMPPYIKK
jgi:hypothetical protein